MTGTVRYRASMATSSATISRLIDDITREFASGSRDLAPSAVAFRNDEAMAWLTAPAGPDAVHTARLLGLAAPLAVADCLVYAADSTADLDGDTTDAIVTVVLVVDGRRVLPTVQLHPYEVSRRLGRSRRKLGPAVVLDEGAGGFGPLVEGLGASVGQYGDDAFRLAAAQRLIQDGVDLQLGETLDRELNDLMDAR